MKIIIEGTAEEISDLIYLQSRKNSANKQRTFAEIKPSLYACVEKSCKGSDDVLRPKSLKADTNVNSIADKQDILTLAMSMEALFEPFSEDIPEYENLKALVTKLKETL